LRGAHAVSSMACNKDATYSPAELLVGTAFTNFFPFSRFNSIQSACIPIVWNSNANLVICAPTGSGKTALMELAILRMLLDEPLSGRALFISPLRAICGEKLASWTEKFATYPQAKCK
jgi:replicative superfamily II helicase